MSGKLLHFREPSSAMLRRHREWMSDYLNWCRDHSTLTYMMGYDEADCGPLEMTRASQAKYLAMMDKIIAAADRLDADERRSNRGEP